MARTAYAYRYGVAGVSFPKEDVLADRRGSLTRCHRRNGELRCFARPLIAGVEDQVERYFEGANV